MTALSYMAAAARPPGISDARVPCPLCGGLIHPVAGRCKHCKASLSQFRSGRPAAAAPLPALHGNTPTATAIPIAIDKIESQPVLPPRPTGRSTAVQAPSSSLLRSWPMLVIILALLAIGTAVVLMVWPPASSDAGKHALQPPPAPEHMETNPIPDHSADPWSAPHSQNDPLRGPRATPDPVPVDPPKPPDDDDVFGGVVGGTVGGTNTLGSIGFLQTELEHACRKLKTCPDVDQTMLSTTCDLIATMPKPPVPSCAEARRCLDAIDNMTCSQSGFANPTSVIMMFQDCTTATTRC